MNFSDSLSVRQRLLEYGLPLGQLRLLSIRGEMSLKFRKPVHGRGSSHGFNYVDFGKFVDPGTWTLDVRTMVRVVLDFSQRQDIGAGELRDRLRQQSGPPEQICVGHDLMGILSVGLRKVLGSRNLSVEDLQERFRLAFERTDLEQTELFKTLRAWETTRPGYRIFQRT